MSPFPFLVCSEGLSALLLLSSRDGLLKEAKLSKSGSLISHLLFANDYILFGEAIVRGAQNFKNILKEYEANSGQCVNFDKSTVFFCASTKEEM